MKTIKTFYFTQNMSGYILLVLFTFTLYTNIACGLHYPKTSRYNNELFKNKCVGTQQVVFPWAMILLLIILVLLILGLLKGLIGLCCSPRIGMFGLNVFLDLPHPINDYYERELQCYKVVYDEEGWPVDPRRPCIRTRIIKESSELCLNVVFFLAYPWTVLCSAMQRLFACNDNSRSTDYRPNNTCTQKESVYVTPCETTQLKKPRCTKCRKHQVCAGPCKNTVRESSRRRGGFETYKDECNTTEEEDTKYVLTQLSKSEQNLKLNMQDST